MLELMMVWTLFSMVAYSYFRYLFAELGFEWTEGNRLACAALSIAGPAALILACVVDGTRPLEVLRQQTA